MIYKNREHVKKAIDILLEVLKPGDIINQTGHQKLWQFWLTITYWAIRHHQKKLFGKNSNWRDTHTMLYLDPLNTFSVEMPKATMKPLQEYCLSDFSIYRLQLIKLTSDHISVLKEVALTMVGEDYDIGQLLDIGINAILGYKNQRRLTLFDFGKKKKVCSVGVRVLFEKLYQDKLKSEEKRQEKWLFYELNPDKWPAKLVRTYRGTDVEATSPAHFANSDYFCKDFKLIARFKNGKEINYKKDF